MSTKSVGSQFRISEGDWVCEDTNCANVNFARRDKCNICGKDKPNSGKDDKYDKNKRKLGHEIGKVAAEKSKGLFSADDWQCGRCGNVNWARRHTCNMCNAPKFGDNDERTGLGGGYNEREEHVEYVQREESDSEYDDFGRKKKKKFRKSNDRNNEDTNDSKHKNISNSSKYDEKKSSKHFKHKDYCNKQKEDIEEEEESEEEVDVSKYKLDSDDDEEDDEDNEEDLSKYDLTSN